MIVGARNGDNDGGEETGSAYIFELNCIEPCPWDFDDTANVGVTDLLALLASWGPCQGCPADFDGDDMVGVTDLLDLLAAWGPC